MKNHICIFFFKYQGFTLLVYNCFLFVIFHFLSILNPSMAFAEGFNFGRFPGPAELSEELCESLRYLGFDSAQNWDKDSSFQSDIDSETESELSSYLQTLSIITQDMIKMAQTYPKDQLSFFEIVEKSLVPNYKQNADCFKDFSLCEKAIASCMQHLKEDFDLNLVRILAYYHTQLEMCRLLEEQVTPLSQEEALNVSAQILETFIKKYKKFYDITTI